MQPNELKALFSRPENDGRIQRSWERFLRHGGGAADNIRCVVEDSWRRCYDANVDPGRDQAPPPMVAHDVGELRLLHRDLLEASKPVMQMARDFLSETETVMVLTDPRGILLELEGDARTLAPAEKIHLLPGANWNEVICGTNAIGTALSLGEPVQIHSAEHYCEGIKRWTCSAAVIHDPCAGGPLGVIDISGMTRTYSPQSLSLVVSAANRIEAYLAKKEMVARYQLLERCIAKLAVNDGSGVVVVDRHGVPIKLNENALAALASLGVSLDLSRPKRLPGFSGAGAATVVQSAELPAWLQLEWIEPIFDRGERIGSLIRIPFRNFATRVGVFGAAPQAVEFHEFPGVKGTSEEFKQAVAKAAQLAKSRVPVLLLGETGAGKEVFARGIHDAASVKNGPFVALNCGGLNRDLLASELFGYTEGAFTGARRGGMKGKIEAADGGTLFLDELGEMPLDLQPAFLRVLEDGQIFRLGENTPRKVSFRLVAATNRDLRKEVAEGRFRMDLFYRISVTSIRIPALRERRGDIRLLLGHFMTELARFHEVPEKLFAAEAVAALEAYEWPGNVRELRNIVESLILTVSGDLVDVDDLPHEICGARRAAEAPQGAEGPSLRGLARGEFEQICKALETTSGNATLAARQLGIAKSTLYLKLKKYSLDGSLTAWRSGSRRPS